MSVSNFQLGETLSHIIVSVDFTALNDQVDFYLPAVGRGITLQRALSGPSAGTVAFSFSLGESQDPTTGFGTASTDAFTSSTSHNIVRGRLKLTALTGTGTVSATVIFRKQL